MSMSVILPQTVQLTEIDIHACQLHTETLMFTCTKLMHVTSLAPRAPAADATVCAMAADDGTYVVCEASLLPPAMKMDTMQHCCTVEQQAPAQTHGHTKADYWGCLHWQLEGHLASNPTNGSVSTLLPDWEAEVLTHTAMSAAGMALPMHGCAVLGHGPAGLYTNWRCVEGVLLTQPWVRALLTKELEANHDSSPHTHMHVGIVCTARPHCILGALNLSQARWLAKNSKLVQAALTECFRSAAERGCIHLAADVPANVAVIVQPSGRVKVFLMNWRQCAQRVRIKSRDQSEVMQYLLQMADGTVDSALQLHQARLCHN